MKHIGPAKIITDNFIHIDMGDIVDVYKYENGDTVYSSGENFNEDSPEYRIFHGHFSYDCEFDEIEII